MSCYYVQQAGTDMTILHLPDEKVRLSRATFKGAAIIKRLQQPRSVGDSGNPPFI